MHATFLEAPSHRQQDIPAEAQVALSPAVSFLDSAVPLQNASHADVVRYDVLTIWRNAECLATLADGRKVKLQDSWQFIGYTGNDPVLRLLFRNNGSHIELRVDGNDLIVSVEALHEDSAPRKWLASIKRSLAAAFTPNADSLIGVLDRDRTYVAVDGSLVSPASCSS